MSGSREWPFLIVRRVFCLGRSGKLILRFSVGVLNVRKFPIARGPEGRGSLTYDDGEFVLPGFGKLVKQKRKARSGFNPKTQQKIKIPAKTVVKFRVAKAAKDAVLGVKK
jgi:hypothetical protein